MQYKNKFCLLLFRFATHKKFKDIKNKILYNNISYNVLMEKEI